MADVDSARAQGWLTDADQIRKVHGLIATRDKALDDVRFFAAADADPSFAFNPVNKQHRDAVDARFRAMGGTVEALQAITERTNMVPASAGTALRGALLSNNPQRVESALQVANALITRNANMLAGIEGHKEIEDAATAYRTYTDDMGFAPREAAQRVMQEATPDRRAQVKAKVKGEDLDKIVRDNFTDPAEVSKAFDKGLLYRAPQVGFDPTQRGAVMGHYASLGREYYEMTGDVTLAKSMARNQLRRVWGVTRVSGRATVTQYPPDRAPAYAGIEGAADKIAASAIAFIKFEAGDDVSRESLRFLPFGTGETARAYREGRPPPYLLAWTDANGTFHHATPNLKYAFVADADAMRKAQTQERRVAFEAAWTGSDASLLREVNRERSVRDAVTDPDEARRILMDRAERRRQGDADQAADLRKRVEEGGAPVRLLEEQRWEGQERPQPAPEVPLVPDADAAAVRDRLERDARERAERRRRGQAALRGERP